MQSQVVHSRNIGTCRFVGKGTSRMNEEIKRPEATEPRWPRWDYKTVWTNLSDTPTQAKMVIAGSEDEESFSRGGRLDADFLREKVAINPTDTVLEIGCGVGRVGAHLAPDCRLWIGCDVSPNMLKFARERLAAVPNLDLVETPGYDLAPIESVSARFIRHNGPLTLRNGQHRPS